MPKRKRINCEVCHSFKHTTKQHKKRGLQWFETSEVEKLKDKIESLQAENKKLKVEANQEYWDLNKEKNNLKNQIKELQESVRQGQHFYEENKKLKEKIEHQDYLIEIQGKKLPRLLAEFLKFREYKRNHGQWFNDESLLREFLKAGLRGKKK